MADTPVPGYVYNPAAGGVIPNSTTTQLPSQSTVTGGSSKIMTPESRAAYKKWLDDEQAKIAAFDSPAPVEDAPTVESLTAQQKLEDDLASGVAKDDNVSGTNAALAAAAKPTAKGKGGELESLMATATPQPDQQPAQAVAAPDISAKNAPRYTQEQFEQAINATRPQTVEEAKDEIARDEGKFAARVNAETEAELLKIRAKQQKDLADALTRVNQASAAYAQSGRAKPYEPTMLQRFALGLGAMGAGLTGGENHAAKLLEAQMRREDETRDKEMTRALNIMKNAGALPEQIEAYAKRATEEALAMKKARLETFAAQAQKVLAPFPQFQQASAQLIAGKRAEVDKEAAQILAANTGRTTESRTTKEGQKVTEVRGDKGNGKPPASNDVQNFSTMQDNARLAARLLELKKKGAVPTGDMRREYEQNENLLVNRAINETEGGKPSVLWSGVMRGLGAIPENVYPEDATPEQREYLDIATVLGHYRVFKMGGQTGLSNAETRRAIMGPGQGGAGEGEDAVRKDEVMANEFVEAGKRAAEVSKTGEEEAKMEARKAGSHAAPQSKSVDKAELSSLPTTARAVASKLSGKEQRDYIDAFNTPKDSPDYEGAQAAIKKLTAKAAKGK